MGFSLECTHGPERGRRFDIDRALVTIGRTGGSDIAIDREEKTVSGRHCEVFVEGGRLGIRDAGSTNGTYVNGVRLDAPCMLGEGDRVELGSGGPVFLVRHVEEPTVRAPRRSAAPPSAPVSARAPAPSPAPARVAAPPPAARPVPVATGGGGRHAFAAVLSTVFPGAGQALNGQLIKGAFILSTCFLVVPWIWGIVDAGRTSRRLAAEGGSGLGGVFLHGWFAANLVVLLLIALTVAGVLT